MANKQVTVATIKEMKQKGEPITMITAYDVAMSRNVNEAGVDMILVGDSLGNVILGYNSTVHVTMDENDSSYQGCYAWQQHCFSSWRYAFYELSGKHC